MTLKPRVAAASKFGVTIQGSDTDDRLAGLIRLSPSEYEVEIGAGFRKPLGHWQTAGFIFDTGSPYSARSVISSMISSFGFQGMQLPLSAVSRDIMKFA